MPSLLESLTALLDESDAAPILAARIGGDAADVAAAIGPSLARVIDGLAVLAADRHGALVAGGLVDQDPHRSAPTTADEVRQVIDGLGPDAGNVILDRVFGAERGLVVIGLASALGLAPSLVGRLLPMMAPLVTLELASRRRASGLDDGQLAALLSADRLAIARAGILAGTAFGDSGLDGDPTAVPPGDRTGGRPARRRLIEGVPSPVNVATIEIVRNPPSTEAETPTPLPSSPEADARPSSVPGSVPDRRPPAAAAPLAPPTDGPPASPPEAPAGGKPTERGPATDDGRTVPAADDEPGPERGPATDGRMAAAAEARPEPGPEQGPEADGRMAAAAEARPEPGPEQGPEADDGRTVPAGEARPEPDPEHGSEADGRTVPAADDEPDPELVPGAAPIGVVDGVALGAEQAPVQLDSDEADVVVVVAEPAPPVEPSADPVVAGDPVDTRGVAMTWLGWAVGAVVLVLLLAWLLSTCGPAASSETDAPTVITVGRPPSVDPAGASTTVDAGRGSDDPARAAGLDSSTRSPATPLTTVAVGTTVGPTVDAAPEVDVAASVAATLIGSGIEGRVFGSAVILTGTVADEARRTDLETRVGSLLGVTSIDNRITVVPPVDEPVDQPVPAGSAGDAAAGDGAAVDPAAAGDAPAADPGRAGDGPGETPEVGSTLNAALELAGVTFDASAADLTADGRATVDQVAAYLQSHPGIAITVDGHTDDDGDSDANLDLSQRRAEAVVARLVAAGVDPERLEAVGHGEARPALPNTSLDNKAVNRRIEFTVSG